MTEQIVGSEMPPLNGYGQNGATNASSDLPGEHTTSGFLPAPDLAGASAAADRMLTRDVGQSNVKPGFGQLGPPPAQGPRR